MRVLSVAAMEEAPNQVAKGVKLVNEEDRISALPDCLLDEILSRLLYTKYAIRTGALSKRWKHLWTFVPSLCFFCYTHDFVSSVDKTLTQCRQLKLKKFQVDTYYDFLSDSQFKNWISYAITRKVEELNFRLWQTDFKAGFSLDESFFINPYFTDLTLEGCMLNSVVAISWKNLRRLCIFWGNLDDDLIENILSGSPLLETLILNNCYGYRRLDIKSKSVKNLVFSGYLDPNDKPDSIEINAPNILSLTIQDKLLLGKLLLLNVPSLVKANLNYFTNEEPTPEEAEAEEEMLIGFLLNLSHVKDLNLWALCSQVLSRLEDKGFIFPSNMKFYDVDFVWSESD